MSQPVSANYLLDTNTISHMMHNADGIVARHLQHLMQTGAVDRLYTSVIVQSELLFGLAKRPTARLQSAYEQQMSGLTVMPIDETVSHSYAAVRLALSRAGTPIGPNDTFIAAHALALGYILVTDNEDEFRRVAGLKVENWSRTV
jgi:tRNA(fMet)-specific endonuclease VapC